MKAIVQDFRHTRSQGPLLPVPVSSSARTCSREPWKRRVDYRAVFIKFSDIQKDNWNFEIRMSIHCWIKKKKEIWIPSPNNHIPSAPNHALNPLRPPDFDLKRIHNSLAGDVTLLGFWLPQKTTESLLLRTTLKSANLCFRVLIRTNSSRQAGVLLTSKRASKWMWTLNPVLTFICHIQVCAGP